MPVAVLGSGDEPELPTRSGPVSAGTDTSSGLGDKMMSATVYHDAIGYLHVLTKHTDSGRYPTLTIDV